MIDKLANSLRAGQAYPPLPVQQAHHDALEGANTGARSALPDVPGHAVPPGRSTISAVSVGKSRTSNG